MAQGEHNGNDQPMATGLDSYRRLIELQKQMIVLSQQYEKAKRECDALRDEVAQEVIDQVRARRSLRHRLHQSAVKYLNLFRPNPVTWLANPNHDLRPPPSARD